MAKAQAAFAAYGRLVTPAIEPLSIPFEGRDIKLWLPKPAGKAGFVTARDGHLFVGDKRIRFGPSGRARF